MYYDPTGNFPILIAIVLGLFTVAGMITGGIVAHNQGKTGWELFGYVMLGGSLGLAVGGAVVSLIGVGAAILGSAGLATSVLGVSASKAFAIGALAYNFFGMFVAPILNITVQPIEWGPAPYTPTKPGETPKHPGNKKSTLLTKRFFMSGIYG